MLTRELRDKWAAALRSGRYKQAMHALRVDADDGIRYCCLGVLCEVAGIERRGNQYHIPNFFDKGRSEDEDEDEDEDAGWTCTEIPTDIAGLNEEMCVMFANMNDQHQEAGRQTTFAKIADEVDKLPVIDVEQPGPDYMTAIRNIAGHD